MKKQMSRKEFELYLLDLRMGALRKKLPNLSDHMRTRMAKKFVKAKMRQLVGDVIEFNVKTKPANSWEAFKQARFPKWLLAYFPVKEVVVEP
jgi:hypothetical protein